MSEDILDDDGNTVDQTLENLEKAHDNFVIETEVLLLKASKELAKKYDFSNQKKLNKFLINIWGAQFDDPQKLIEKVSIGKFQDQPDWKDTRQKFLRINNNLSQAYGELYSLIKDENELVLFNLDGQKSEDDFYELVESLGKLIKIVNAASQLYGKRGHPKNPDWHQKTAQMAKAYWLENKGEEAKTYFLPIAKTTTPGNNFTKWYCDLMIVIDNKITPSICKTALNKN